MLKPMGLWLTLDRGVPTGIWGEAVVGSQC